MAGGRIRPDTAAQLKAALSDPDVVDRYRSKIRTVESSECSYWTGAISAQGHGRFWLRADWTDRDFAVIAHRFGFALEHGFDTLMRADLLAHECDNTLCQRIGPEHVHTSTRTQNRRDWAARRHHVGGPLRDTRGARARAIAIRDAILAGQPLDDVHLAGLNPLDRDQLPLWE